MWKNKIKSMNNKNIEGFTKNPFQQPDAKKWPSVASFLKSFKKKNFSFTTQTAT